MRLAIDLDGVVANFADRANSWLSQYLGQDLKPIKQWDWFNTYEGGAEAWEVWWKQVENARLFRYLDPLPGAVPTLRRLADRHPITYVTHRPAWAHEDTERWLEKHKLPGQLVIVDNVEDKAKQLGDVFLDDYGPTVELIRIAGKSAYLFRQPWNTAWWSALPSVGSWIEFEEAVSRWTP